MNTFCNSWVVVVVVVVVANKLAYRRLQARTRISVPLLMSFLINAVNLRQFLPIRIQFHDVLLLSFLLYTHPLCQFSMQYYYIQYYSIQYITVRHRHVVYRHVFIHIHYTNSIMLSSKRTFVWCTNEMVHNHTIRSSAIYHHIQPYTTIYHHIPPYTTLYHPIPPYYIIFNSSRHHQHHQMRSDC